MGSLRVTKYSVASLTLIAGCMIASAVFADNLPDPMKLELPFESAGNGIAPVISIIKASIMYVGVLAMLSLSWGGMQFIVSIGAEEKVKKAKSIVLYSLLGVILSITAYSIIDIVNSLRV